MIGYVISLTALLFSTLIPFAIVNFPHVKKFIDDRTSPSYSQISFENIGETSERLEKNLKEVKGQKEAITKIVDLISSWQQTKCEDKINKTKTTGALLLYFIGSSGCGKTMTSEIITKTILNGKPPINISVNSINTKSKDPVDIQVLNGGLWNQLKRNPRTVFIVDEYDKMHKKDHSLDSRLWNLADNGQLKFRNESIDCSETIFIIISNEVADENIYNDLNSKDQEVTYLYKNHSRPFLNRANIILFKNLTAKDYFEILLEETNMILKENETKTKVKIKPEKKSFGEAAEKIEKLGQGARAIRSFLAKERSVLMRVKGLDQENEYLMKYNSINDIFEICKKKPKCT
jgi:ATP-dependent Clp protease ATP-binding subunit ClpA